MSAVTFLLPLLNTESGCMIAGGIVAYTLGAFASSARAASRFQALAFCVFTAGSVPVVKGIADAFTR